MRFPNLRRPSIDVRQISRRVVRSKLLWTVAALVGLYSLAGFFLAPYLVERYLPSLAQEHLGRQASVEDVRINPYTLTVEASGFRLQDETAKALLTFDRLFVDYELSSLFRRAWIFEDVRLEGAHLALEIRRDGRLNLLELLDRLRKPPQPDEGPLRLVLNHLTLTEGRLSLTDLSGSTPASASIAPIDLELSGLNTLSAGEGRFTVEARLPAGGTLTSNGSIALEPVATTGEIVMRGMNLETLWPFVRDQLSLARPSGELTISARYRFTDSQGAPALSVTGLTAELSNLSLALPDEKQPLVALKTVRMSDASFTFPERELVVQKLLLANGAANATVSEDGTLDWNRATAHLSDARPAVKEDASVATAEPFRVRLLGVTVENVALGYEDRSMKPALAVRTAELNAGLSLEVTSGAGPTRLVAGDIRLALANLAAVSPGTNERYATLDALTLAGGRVDTNERAVGAQRIELRGGELMLAVGADGPSGLLAALSTPSAAPSEAAPSSEGPSAPEAAKEKRETAQAQPASEASDRPWRMEVEKIAVEKIALRYEDASRKPALAVRVGELNSDFNVQVVAGAGRAQFMAGDLQLSVDDIALSSSAAKTPVARLDSLRLTGGRLDTGARVVAANTIAAAGGAVTLVRGAGEGGLLDALMAQPQEPAAARAAEPSAPASEWAYRVDSAELKRIDVALADRTFKPEIAYDLEVASITAKNVDSSSKTPIAIEAALRVGKEGAASAEAAVQQDFAGANARVAVTRVQLEPLQPLLAQYAALDLKSGRLSAKTRVEYRRGGEPALRARGQMAVDDFLANEAGTNERFASWKTLGAEGIDLTLSPDRLAVRQVRFVQPGAKIVIDKDRTINITDVIRTREPSEPASPEAAGQRRAKAEEAPAFPYEIGTVRFDNGTLDFADLSLVLPFATQVQALDGAIVNISSDPQARAELKLAGQVDEYGEASASGVFIPRDPEKFLDITARFENVDMPLLSPYAATFAGRKVAAGKLSLVLEYKIVNSELAGENRIVLRDFKLGERVEAPDALDLPLDLAVALLKDSEGRIRLDVPVSGNVGNPQFDYGKVIRAAIGNAIGRIVTAPFRALAGLFGKRDAEAVREVKFAPGSDAIAPAQREQLDALAKALKARPQLRLVVKGPYDPEQDARQLRREQARLDLARALRAKLQPGEDPGPIAYGRADTQRALEELLTKRAGPDALAELEKAYAKRTGRQPDRVNPMLGRVGRASNDTEFYEAVFDRLVEAEPLSDTAVRVLAGSRAQAIVDVLSKAGIDGDRVQVGGITQVEAASGSGITTELALDAMPGAS